MLKYIKSTIMSLISIASITACLNIYSYANETISLDYVNRGGSGHWESSALREWLNSDADMVSYTSPSPSYAKEAGFLTNFTEQEKNAMAITKRKNLLATDVQGWSAGGDSELLQFNRTPSINFDIFDFEEKWNGNRFFYNYINDKMFILNPGEYYYYVLNRESSHKKEVMQEAKKIHGITEQYMKWWLSASMMRWADGSLTFVANNSDYVINSQANCEQHGVVPAVHIKPGFTFSNGKNSSNLSIGDKVPFGNYRGEPIIWEVVNIADGYPLLLSEKIIDRKEFNQRGSSLVYKHSNYINYNSFDIDISNDLKYRATIDGNDHKSPRIIIENESELNKRQTGSFTLNLRIDDESSIKYVQTPDGNKYFNLNRLSYTVDTNKLYPFKAVDSKGNRRDYMIAVANINIPAHVLVEQSETDWTKNDVLVNIKASNDIGWEFDSMETSERDTNGDTWANYTSYAGAKIRVSGEIEFVRAKDGAPINDTLVGIGAMFNKVEKAVSGEFGSMPAWSTARSWTIKELYEQGKQSFDFIYTVPEDYFSHFRPWIQIDIPHSSNQYTIRLTNLKFKLLDDSSFAIEKIVLPDGTEINQSSYTHRLTSQGEYTYSVFSNNGVTVDKKVVALIDKKPPEIDINYSKEPTRNDIELIANITDSQSGLNKITLPDGTETQNASIQYVITENGIVKFKAIDNVGNEAIKSVDINNIDRIIDEVNYSYTPTELTNKDVNITLTSRDTNGIKHIVLPDGNKVTSDTATLSVKNNGVYSFMVEDVLGNFKVVSVKIDNIDKIKPTVEIVKNPDKEWVNTDVSITINAND